MRYYGYARDNGEVQFIVSLQDDIAPAELPDLTCIESNTNLIGALNYVNGEFIERPREMVTIEAARRQAVFNINTARLNANQTYFTHLDRQIAVDPLSRSDIDAINGEINNTGAFPTGWPGAWKCLDNTWLPVTTVSEWKALYSSMVNQGTANFAKTQQLKAQIEAATTPEAVAVIVW